MIARVLDFLAGRAVPAVAASSEDLDLAVAALLVEAARMDDDFDADERRAIEHLLAEKFALAPDQARRLIDQAETAVREATHYYPFTRRICASLPSDERIRIVEMLWRVAYADGALDAHEDMLLRRVAGLIHVPDQDRASARQRALAMPRPARAARA